jgi:hypothetical protein
MGQITLTIDITNSDGATVQVKKVVETSADIPPGRETVLLDEVAFDVAAELHTFDNWSALPRPSDLARQSKQARTPLEPTDMINPWNADGLWLEIYNSYLHVAHSLARAKSYKDVEPTGVPIEGWYYCHAEKIAALDLAVFFLAKIQDLVVRLLYESIGERLISVDLTDPDWPRQMTLKNLKNGLARLRSSGALDAAEYNAIISAIEIPSRTPRGALVVDYRNSLAHRIRPSVDHAELSPVLQERIGRPVYDEHGTQRATSWPFRVGAARPDHTFNELYAAFVEYLGAVISMLEELKSLPRFA